MTQQTDIPSDEPRPIRLAYVSADFREHPVGHLLIGVVEQHDRSRFEIVGVSVGHDDGSRLANRFKEAFDYCLRMKGATAAKIAQAIRDLDVDIAVDLGGYTAESRYDVFGHRPAPIQINWLGYPGTMGAPAYDYIIADRIVIPPELECHYSEKVIRLPNAYMPTDSSLKVAGATPSRVDCGLPKEGIVFCSFNQSMKFTQEVFTVWMRLLKEVEGSVLWLRGDNDLVQTNLCNFAERHGVEGSRLVFAPRLPRVEDHLARYRVADLFLDTFPYNAHTTAADALFAGLPVVTLTGESFASRVGASLLTTLGLEALVTYSLDEYFALARELSADPLRLRTLRDKLAQPEVRAALFDTDKFVQGLESALLTVHRSHKQGIAPFSFQASLPVQA